MRDQHKLISGPAGDIEALLRETDAAQQVAICCHPHPLHGGSMHNKVVHTLHRTFQERGCHTLRFNFRGVGNSHGSFADGIGETEDLLAVVRWVQRQWPELPINLSGFSFGAFVSLNVVGKVALNCLVSVAPPVEHFYFKDITVPDFPWIVIQPMADEVVNAEAVINWVEDNSNLHTRLIKIDGASHFLHGKLVEMKEKLHAALDELGLGRR